jgi:hypothetical protein
MEGSGAVAERKLQKIFFETIALDFGRSYIRAVQFGQVRGD